MINRYNLRKNVLALSATGLMLFATSASSQTVDFVEALQSHSDVHCQGSSIAPSGDNELLLTGTYSGRVFLGNHELNSGANYSQILLAKLNNTGELLWLKEAGGPSIDRGNDVAVDSVGNVYVTGSFTGSADFGGSPAVSLINNGHEDMFVAKYSKDGVLSWAKNAGSLGTAYGNSIAVDLAGDVYVTGSFIDQSFSEGGNPITSNTFDIFIAKYSGSDGTLIWAKSAKGKGMADAGLGIATDSSGGVFVAGKFSETATFGTNSLTAVNKDGFVAKYSNSDGMVIWAKAIGGQESGDDSVNGLAVDETGDVYVTGDFSGKTNISTTTLTSSGKSDIFLAGFSNTGALIFAESFGAQGDDLGKGVSVNGTEIKITGSFEDSMVIGNTTLTSKGMKDIFVGTFSKTGTPKAVLSGGGSSDDIAEDIAIFPSVVNVSTVLGSFQGLAEFGGNDVVSVANMSDMIIGTIAEKSSVTAGTPGDLTGDNRVGLGDAIGILRLLSGKN